MANLRAYFQKIKWFTLTGSLLIFVSAPTHAKDKTVQRMFASRKDAACEKTYDEFYKKDDLDFRVVFGYKDARPARLVTDRYERMAFIQRLTALGFKRDSTDNELLNLEIRTRENQLKKIHLRVVQSSVGADDELNKSNPFQKWQTGHAHEIFQDGLKTANVVIYVGHSRKGGGPDFEPPRCTSDGHVNYAWYEKRQQGLHEMQASLKSVSGNRDRRLIGLLSCDSDKHFSDGMKSLGLRTGRISNKSALYFADSIDDLLVILTGLTQFRCAPDLVPPGTALTGFF